jgi:hypothetical protein
MIDLLQKLFWSFYRSVLLLTTNRGVRGGHILVIIYRIMITLSDLFLKKKIKALKDLRTSLYFQWRREQLATSSFSSLVWRWDLIPLHLRIVIRISRRSLSWQITGRCLTIDGWWIVATVKFREDFLALRTVDKGRSYYVVWYLLTSRLSGKDLWYNKQCLVCYFFETIQDLCLVASSLGLKYFIIKIDRGFDD